MTIKIQKHYKKFIKTVRRQTANTRQIEHPDPETRKG